MKLLINGKYENVGFWSFVKCNILVELALLGLLYGVIFLSGVIVGIVG